MNRLTGRVAVITGARSREADIAAAIQGAAEAFGQLDILFNNAGAGGSPQTLAEKVCLFG
jgi:NAD(P)-dependent dehydrogenase (short-subunit alcohol dehydrogenase family)